MEKIKIALTIISIAIVIGPLAGIALIYRNNLADLVLPPPEGTPDARAHGPAMAAARCHRRAIRRSHIPRLSALLYERSDHVWNRRAVLLADRAGVPEDR